MHFDLPQPDLERYLPERHEPQNFDAFWAETLQETRTHPLSVRLEAVKTGFKLVEVYDLSFAGFNGQTIKGWLVLPKMHAGKLPCVVEFIGYGGGRNLPTEWLLWANLGYAHVVMDTRGQGSTWSKGDTPDPEAQGSNPHHPGFMTRGILNPKTYYYRRVFSDAVRAVEVALQHDRIDPTRIAVTGASQGGGIALAVAALEPRVASVMPDVPFLCHMRRAIGLVDTMPYAEITKYLTQHRDQIEQALATLDYFDGTNFAARATAPALFSVGLMDTICPPSTVYAAHNHYAGQKQMVVWPFNNHEGGQSFQTTKKIEFLANLFA